MYIFHCDPGHAWLAVKRKELIRLNILDKISGYSYEKGETVYLEEDCDAAIFLNAKAEAGEDVGIKDSYHEDSPIRNYNNFVQ